MTTKDIIIKILSEHTEDNVMGDIDDVRCNYIDDGWEDDGYDSEYDWYVDHCTDEAESEVINGIIRDVTTDLSIDDFCLVYDTLIEVWDIF